MSHIKSFIIVVCLLMASFVSQAQDDFTDPCTDPTLPCPIDGGLSLLIAAAIGIGAKKAYAHRKDVAQTISL